MQFNWEKHLSFLIIIPVSHKCSLKNILSLWQNILVTIKINFTCQFGPWGAQMFVQIFCWVFLWRCFWMSLTLKSKDWLKPMALPNVMGLSQSAESLHASKVDSHLNKSFPGGTSIREPANAGDVRDMGSPLGREDPLEKDMTTHFSILAWGISRTEENGGLQSISLQSQTRLRDLASTFE